MTVGQSIGYAKRFLKQIKTPATDPAWFRRGILVAVPGDLSPDYRHWKTDQPIPIAEGFALVKWADTTYPNEDGHNANLIRLSAIAVVGSGRFAEEI